MKPRGWEIYRKGRFHLLPIAPEEDGLSDLFPEGFDEEHFSLGLAETGPRARPIPAPRKSRLYSRGPSTDWNLFPRPDDWEYKPRRDPYQQPWDRGDYP
jgi:hypothetical protein